MSLILRDDQRALIDDIRAAMRTRNRSVLVQAPTGFGKTVMICEVIRRLNERGKRCWFVVHRRELIDQSVRTIEQMDLQCGVVSPGFPPDPYQPIQVCSVRSLANRWRRLPSADVVIVDECHHTAAAGWSKLLEALGPVWVIGLTATPERLDGTGLGHWYQTMVLGPQPRELIDAGRLADYRLFAPYTPDMEAVGTVAGDWNKKQTASKMDKPRIIGDAVSHYQRLCLGARALVNCASVEMSKHTAQQFIEAGFRAVHLDGKTDRQTRAQADRDFRSGALQVLCNVELFGEGYDVPDAEVCVLLRPTKSLGVYLQQVGRVLRPKPDGRKAIILDHSGNSQLHGLPDDDREWSLEGRRKRKGKQDDKGTPIKICPRCFAAVRIHVDDCPECGHHWQPAPRQIQQDEGELVEIDKARARKERRVAQGRAKSFDELVALGTERGYRNPEGWAKHVCHARMRKHG